MAVMNPYNYSKPKSFVRVEPQKKIMTSVGENKPNAIGDKMDQYLESKIIAAKPEELTFMLYEGLVKFIKKAMLTLETKNYEQVNYNTQRAQAIVDELRSTLNMDIPLSESLDALYEYLGFKLLNANVGKSEEEYGEALEIAENFKDTWKEAFNIK
ncbi:flagellar export chaperone FliS [Fusibacter bizertensis]|jgi:flagellar biosynthetic protein FliS|uniref:Flagellar export chaperone FliS n=1 Tax=Fusibacter bizertensis TaxID=1488331 RepID=A0ABT6NDU6_9FIRM|nr:flagellar export chaperone FliS [Fusibacter bizertensis]MDH8678607.1 flagellar export chaperone FliS [Fusibacter bizertensis]